MSPQANPITNLDIRCAEVGRQLANAEKMEEKVLNEALAVLEEQGPYAMFLYIKARYKDEKKEVAQAFQNHCVLLLKGVFVGRIQDNAGALEAVKQLAENLDDLLFARDLLRNALGYARYHLKGKGS